MKFQDLGLSAPLLRAISEKGYETPTPIQEQAIPPVLRGRDLQGCAQTGTGKTAAFTLPILQLLAEEPPVRGRREIRALVLTPTRELAIQIDECCRDYARYTSIRHGVIFGGVNQRPQVEALERGIDLLVATPGRLLDLIGQGYITLKHLRFFVLDEADRMLDMGFIHDIRRILPLLPERRQTLFFSATMPADIAALATRILHDPELVTVTPPASVVETIAQRVRFAEKSEKSDRLIELLHDSDARQVLVFTRTKHGADRLARILNRAGIGAAAIHGNKSQNARVRAMNDFKSGACRVLIATDIAARGIDIDQLPLVVNYDLPEVAETYVHRIGRTGRAGHEGQACSFCSEAELEYLLEIQKLTGLTIPVEGEVPAYAAEALEAFARRNERKGGKSNRHADKSRRKAGNASAEPAAAQPPRVAEASAPKITPSQMVQTGPQAAQPNRPDTAQPAQAVASATPQSARPQATQPTPTAASVPESSQSAGTKRNRRRRRKATAANEAAAPVSATPKTVQPAAKTNAASDTPASSPRQAKPVKPARQVPSAETVNTPRQTKPAKPSRPEQMRQDERSPKPGSATTGSDRNANRNAAPKGRQERIATDSARPSERTTHPDRPRHNRRPLGPDAQSAPKRPAHASKPAPDRTKSADPKARAENRISHTNDWKNRVKSLLLRTFGK